MVESLNLTFRHVSPPLKQGWSVTSVTSQLTAKAHPIFNAFFSPLLTNKNIFLRLFYANFFYFSSFPAFCPLLIQCPAMNQMSPSVHWMCLAWSLMNTHCTNTHNYPFLINDWLNVIGWLNSVTGMVKTYIKSRFSADQQNSKENDKMKSLATVSPMRSSIATNPFAQSPSNMAVKTSSYAQNMYERHRSPDPPPRNTRGHQSPLVVRRKLELASSSPLLQRR